MIDRRRSSLYHNRFTTSAARLCSSYFYHLRLPPPHPRLQQAGGYCFFWEGSSFTLWSSGPGYLPPLLVKRPPPRSVKVRVWHCTIHSNGVVHCVWMGTIDRGAVALGGKSPGGPWPRGKWPGAFGGGDREALDQGLNDRSPFLGDDTWVCPWYVWPCVGHAKWSE